MSERYNNATDQEIHEPLANRCGSDVLIDFLLFKKKLYKTYLPDSADEYPSKELETHYLKVNKIFNEFVENNSCDTIRNTFKVLLTLE